jgi:HK97 family phage portal protein
MVLWRAITDWVVRRFQGGSPSIVFATEAGAQPQEYAPDNAMSTLAKFWAIWVAIAAITTDMAGLPMVAVRRTGPRPEDRQVVTDDPGLRLLQRPNAFTTYHQLMTQLWADRELTGNAYLWMPEGKASVAIYRLHPQWVRPVVGAWGVVLRYVVCDQATNTEMVLSPDQMCHFRGLSWQDDPAAAAYGESPIRAIHDDLTADMGARKIASKVSAKGRPDILFSVKGGGTGPKMIDQLKARWEQTIASLAGAFVVGAEVTATPLSWSPKDIGNQERANALRDEILMLFGVPPTRAGLPSAAYGGARQEARVYWETRRGKAAEFEDALTNALAGPGVRLEYDFSGVEALQVSYTERLMRVASWVGLGATPAAAAAYEGFDNAPVGDSVDAFHSPRPIDRQPENPSGDGNQQLALVNAAVELHLRCAEAAYADLDDSVDRRLFVRWQVERLFHELDRVGVEPKAARWWAEEIAGITDEAHRMGLAETFTAARAQRVAGQIVDALRRAA